MFERQTNSNEKLRKMKATVKFTEKSSESRMFNIEGLGNCTLHLFEIVKNSFAANTFFKKGEIAKVKFLTLHENGKKYYTHIENEFELVALNDTETVSETIQFIGERTVHSTDFTFDVEKIKSELFSYQKMTSSQVDAFNLFEEDGKAEKQFDNKDITDMSRENDGR